MRLLLCSEVGRLFLLDSTVRCVCYLALHSCGATGWSPYLSEAAGCVLRSGGATNRAPKSLLVRRGNRLCFLEGQGHWLNIAIGQTCRVWSVIFFWSGGASGYAPQVDDVVGWFRCGHRSVFTVGLHLRSLFCDQMCHRLFPEVGGAVGWALKLGWPLAVLYCWAY